MSDKFLGIQKKHLNVGRRSRLIGRILRRRLQTIENKGRGLAKEGKERGGYNFLKNARLESSCWNQKTAMARVLRDTPSLNGQISGLNGNYLHWMVRTSRCLGCLVLRFVSPDLGRIQSSAYSLHPRSSGKLFAPAEMKTALWVRYTLVKIRFAHGAAATWCTGRIRRAPWKESCAHSF
jgi:hypothetical protein